MLRKITDFIVDKRYWILGAFAILAVVGVFLMGKVKINSDMMEYLPKDSETRIGLDVMTEEFGEDDDSDLTVMFEGLSDAERLDARDYLASLNGVTDVAYDDSDSYNRDEYARYVLTIGDTADSELAAEVYDKIKQSDLAKNHAMYMSGSVEDENGEVLHFSIIVIAVVAALVILIIMSESYVEPFLFLTTILIAVVLNKATNLMFPSVSNITDSIVAILQMALSMDYSIMLMNRYIQERETESNKVKAMKKALYAAFAAISSSSVTTVVGLLALVFMSFTIGRDLGFVLAKGVLFSLIAIFTCLPSLILLCDKLIEKTKKPSPHFKLNWAGTVAHKMRFVGLPIFVAVFVASFILKGNLGIFYSSPLENKIEDVFGSTNQFVVLYDKEYEPRVAEYCRDLMDGEKIENVLCYGNTIGDRLAADELTGRIETFGADVQIDDYLLKLIYYYYYNDGQGADLTLMEFVDFVQTEVLNNPVFADKLDAAMRNKIQQLANFARVSEVERRRSANNIASILGVDAEQVEDLFVYYNSRNTNQKLSVVEFTKFLQEYVVKTKYGANFGAAEQTKLAQLSGMMSLAQSQVQLTYNQMAATFGVAPELIRKIYVAKSLEEVLASVSMGDNVGAATMGMSGMSLDAAMQAMPVNLRGMVMQRAETLVMTPSEFVEIAVQNIEQVDLEQRALIVQVGQIFRLTNTKQTLTTAQMAEFMGLPTETVRLLYSLYEIEWQNKVVEVSLRDFVNFLTGEIVDHPNYASNFDAAMRRKLQLVQRVMNNTVTGVTYSPAELTKTLNELAGGDLQQDLVELVYLYRGSVEEYDASWKMSVEDFANYLQKVILVDERFDSFVSDDMRNKVDAAVETVADAKALLVGDKYARIVITTTYDEESEETFGFIKSVKEQLAKRADQSYVIGNSLMAYEMSLSFGDEMNLITILTMVFIFVVVAVTFKSLITPIILVALIQCAVYFTMGIMTVVDGEMYFIAILIVQSILMGATIDYAILYTSYYIEARATKTIKKSLSYAYTNSIHAIMTSGLILILVTLVVGNFASAVASKICLAISQGTTCSILLILILLPAMLAACDKLVVKHNKQKALTR